MKRFVKASDEPEKPRTPEELEQALEEDIGYVILQTCPALKLFHDVVVPVLEKNGLHKEIAILNNASLESQLLFLRKLNEFFMPLPKKKRLKEDDLRAEHSEASPRREYFSAIQTKPNCTSRLVTSP